MDIEMFLTPGLGDATWLIGSEGEAALVDCAERLDLHVHPPSIFAVFGETPGGFEPP